MAANAFDGNSEHRTGRQQRAGMYADFPGRMLVNLVPLGPHLRRQFIKFQIIAYFSWFLFYYRSHPLRCPAVKLLRTA